MSDVTYVLIETVSEARLEILNVMAFATEARALATFEQICAEHQVHREPIDNEIAGTIAIAGDDTYCVQLVARKAED